MSSKLDYTPVALYARVSSDRQDVDLSIAAQLRALRDYANKNGYIVVREYVDEAESGRIADRPEFRKMIDAASKTSAPFQEILVWKFSRFTRKREHAVAFKSMLRRKGVRVVSITEHADDTPTGKLMEAIIESVDEFYSENLVWGTAATDGADPVRVERAFPYIVSKVQFRRVNARMRSRSPRITHPRRVASSYLLSGLVKCKACNRALSGQDAKSGQFSYYVCQSIMKRGKNACKTPRLNARRFEEMVVGKIRSNVLTDGNIRALVKVVDEQMDGVAQEQRTKLETIEDELEDVKRKLGRIWHFVETTDIDMADAAARIREHRDRQERLEDAATEARAILSQRRAELDDVETIAAYAQDMSEFLNESELTERRAFIETFVKEIVVMPGDALMRYTIPISQSTQKTELFLGGRFGHNQVSSGGSAGGRATSTLIAGSIPHRWALLDG